MSEPTPLTPAGQALRRRLEEIGVRDPERGLISDAERQAADRALAELRREVEAEWPRHGEYGNDDPVTRFLALIDKASKPEEGA